MSLGGTDISALAQKQWKNASASEILQDGRGHLHEYTTVQIPPAIRVQGAAKGTEAAAYLEEVANRMSRDGWEFHRIDTVGVVESPGCLAGLLGARQIVRDFFVVSFRRPV